MWQVVYSRLSAMLSQTTHRFFCRQGGDVKELRHQMQAAASWRDEEKRDSSILSNSFIFLRISLVKLVYSSSCFEEADGCMYNCRRDFESYTKFLCWSGCEDDTSRRRSNFKRFEVERLCLFWTCSGRMAVWLIQREARLRKV